MFLGQVWFTADCDGTNLTAFEGGRGSAFAVTAQNAGADGVWETDDDLDEPLNKEPPNVTVDASPGGTGDLLDRVRGFYSFHEGGSIFVYADGSTHFVTTEINQTIYRALSTRAGGEIARDF